MPETTTKELFPFSNIALMLARGLIANPGNIKTIDNKRIIRYKIESFITPIYLSLFSDIKYNGTLSAGNKYVVPMEKIFDLIWVDELKENQERYGS